jgi:hypothetical protein
LLILLPIAGLLLANYLVALVRCGNQAPTRANLSYIRRVEVDQAWSLSTVWRWSDSLLGTHWPFVAANGAVFYADDMNIYARGPGIEQATVETLRESFPIPLVSCLPDGTRGFYSCNWYRQVVHILPDMRLAWQRELPAPAPTIDPSEHRVYVVGDGSGSLYALSQRTLWQIAADSGEILVETPLSDPLSRTLAVLWRGTGLIVLAGNTAWDSPGRELTVQAIAPNGALRWQRSFKAPGIGWLYSLPDDRLLVVLDRVALISLDSEGIELWRQALDEELYYSGGLAVAESGTLAIWAKDSISLTSVDGKPVGRPLRVGRTGIKSVREPPNLIAGANSNFYAHLQNSGDSAKPGFNTIIAISPNGQPIQRHELGQDSFNLIAVGASGELYGLRRGETLSADGFTGELAAELVCLRPEPQ